MRGMFGGARLSLAPLALLVAACSSGSPDPSVVTADEERQLDEAAAMLDANSVALDNVTQDGPVTTGATE